MDRDIREKSKLSSREISNRNHLLFFLQIEFLSRLPSGIDMNHAHTSIKPKYKTCNARCQDISRIHRECFVPLKLLRCNPSNRQNENNVFFRLLVGFFHVICEVTNLSIDENNRNNRKLYRVPDTYHITSRALALALSLSLSTHPHSTEFKNSIQPEVDPKIEEKQRKTLN